LICTCITCELIRLTGRLEDYRRWRMGMTIKWNITAKAMKARGIMDQISAEYEDFIIDGSDHLADVKALKSQVGELKDDLYAAANVLGNSGGASDPIPSPPIRQTGSQAPGQPSASQIDPRPPEAQQTASPLPRGS
jgi:hypothetical protein